VIFAIGGKNRIQLKAQIRTGGYATPREISGKTGRTNAGRGAERRADRIDESGRQCMQLIRHFLAFTMRYASLRNPQSTNFLKQKTI